MEENLHYLKEKTEKIFDDLCHNMSTSMTPTSTKTNGIVNITKETNISRVDKTFCFINLSAEEFPKKIKKKTKEKDHQKFIFKYFDQFLFKDKDKLRAVDTSASSKSINSNSKIDIPIIVEGSTWSYGNLVSFVEIKRSPSSMVGILIFYFLLL